jgi:hypothetical protein
MTEEYDANVSNMAGELLAVMSGHPVMTGLPALALTIAAVFEQLAEDGHFGYGVAVNAIEYYRKVLTDIEGSISKAPEGVIIQ